MILVDDPEKTVIEPLAETADAMEKLYETELMACSGHVTGRRVDRAGDFGRIASALEKLNARGGMLFAMGDGNHSMATAKAWWDELKQGLSAGEGRRTRRAGRWRSL